MADRETTESSEESHFIEPHDAADAVQIKALNFVIGKSELKIDSSHRTWMVTLCMVSITSVLKKITLNFDWPLAGYGYPAKIETFDFKDLSALAKATPQFVLQILGLHEIYIAWQNLPCRVYPTHVNTTVDKIGNKYLRIGTSEIKDACNAVFWWATYCPDDEINYIAIPTNCEEDSWCVNAVLFSDAVIYNGTVLTGPDSTTAVEGTLSFSHRMSASITPTRVKVEKFFQLPTWGQVYTEIPFKGVEGAMFLREWHTLAMDRNLFFMASRGDNFIKTGPYGLAHRFLTVGGVYVEDTTEKLLAGVTEIGPRSFLTLAGCYVNITLPDIIADGQTTFSGKMPFQFKAIPHVSNFVRISECSFGSAAFLSTHCLPKRYDSKRLLHYIRIELLTPNDTKHNTFIVNMINKTLVDNFLWVDIVPCIWCDVRKYYNEEDNKEDNKKDNKEDKS